MRIGTLHAVTLTLAPGLAAAGVISGSPVLAASAVTLIGVLALTARRLLDTDRSKTAVIAVHALTVVLLIAALFHFRTSRIDAVLMIVMLGIFNRFVLRNGQRDDFLIAGASVVLMAAATTITPGVLFLLFVLSFIPATLFAMWSSMLLGGAERDATEPAQKVRVVKAMASRPAPGGMARIALLGFALTVAGYAVVSLFPRYTFIQMLGAGYFMALSGSTPTMELRTDGAETLADSTPVIRVEPFNGRESSVSGLYARVQVLDTFDGRTFSASSNGALYPVVLPADGEGDQDMNELSAKDTKETVRITLNRLVRGNHEHPLAVLGRGNLTEIVKRNVRRTSGGSWMSTQFRGTSTVYKARLDKTITGDSRLPKHLREIEANTLLAVPETLDPRVVQLGHDLTDNKATVDEKVNAVMRHLSRGFEYSLEPLAGVSTDPLARFLFEAKKGHCELYAAALAVLLRVGGVRTRVAAGYYGGAWNSLGGYLTYTSQDAHAWVEVHDDNGWRWIDATPEDLRGSRSESTALQTLRDWYDAAETFWFDNVLDFDEEKRRAFIARVGGKLDQLSEDAESAFTGQGTRVNASRGWIAVLIAAPLGLFFGLRALRRRRVDPVELGGRVRRALGAEDDENVTLGVLLARVNGEDPAVATAARKTVELYEELRFGAPAEAPKAAEVLAALEALKSAKRRSGRAPGPGPG